MNYIIIGTNNFHRFTYHGPLPMEEFVSVTGITAIGEKNESPNQGDANYSSFVDLTFPPVRLSYRKKPDIDFATININLNHNWLEQNFGSLKVRREHLGSLYFDILFDPDEQIDYMEYFVNFYAPIIITDTSTYIARHKIFSFDYVKTCLEFDDGLANCTEFDGVSPLKMSYLISVTRLTESRTLVIEPTEAIFVKNSFYVVFRDENNQPVNIDKFLVHIKF
jgi:hypothetical protein